MLCAVAKVIQDVCDPYWYGGTAAAMDELYGWASAYASVRPAPAATEARASHVHVHLSAEQSLSILDPLLSVNAAAVCVRCMLNGRDGKGACVCTTPSPTLH